MSSALLYPADWRWNADLPHGSAITVSFSFMAANPGPYGGFRVFTEGEKAAARTALAAWSKVCNVSFAEVASGGQIAFGGADLGKASGMTLWQGVAGKDSGLKTTHADIYLSATQGMNFTEGGFGLRALLHEIGHALGLKHSFDTTGPTLTGAENSAQYTIMSYDNAPDTPMIQPSGPQLYDIAAAQSLYGANMATNAGDTLYRFAANQTLVKTLWDGGGTDTLDCSAQSQGAIIDLRAGHFSSIGLYAGEAARNNVCIADKVMIEEAVGGSGNDTITGNDSANLLLGGAGADVMAGGLGGDTYGVDQAGDRIVEASNAGIDTVRATVTWNLVTFVENLELAGAAAIHGTGTSWHNRITGNDAANALWGLAGNDILDGKGGNDVLVGGAGADVLTGGGGADVFKYLSTGDLGGDRITDFTGGTDRIILAGSAFGLAPGQAQAGMNFCEIAGAFDGTNATSSAFLAGKASLVADGTGNVYYDSNGKAAGYGVVASVQAGAHPHAADLIIA